MATQTEKDMRDPDLIVPYEDPPAKENAVEFSSTLSSTLPMAAMLTRNRFIGWASVVFSVQSWLGESEDTRKNTSTPGYFSVAMAVMALFVTYMPIFMPPPAALNKGTATEAAAPVPPS